MDLNPSSPTARAADLDLTRLMDRYLLWIETHHFAHSTVQVRRLTLTFFIAWCDARSVTRADQVTRDLLERFQRHLYHSVIRPGCGAGSWRAWS